MGVKIKQDTVPAAARIVTDTSVKIVISAKGNGSGGWLIRDFRALVTTVDGKETERVLKPIAATAGEPVADKYPNADGGFLSESGFTLSQLKKEVPTIKAGAVEINTDSLVPLLLDAMDKMRNATILARKKQAVAAAKEALKEPEAEPKQGTPGFEEITP